MIFRCITMLTAFFTTCAAMAQEVKITPEFPERNQLVTVTFTPSSNNEGINGSDTGVVMVFTSGNLYDMPNRLPLQKKGNLWQTSFPLARYATHATFTLESGTKVQRPSPDKHYAIAVYEKGKRIKSGYLYESYSQAVQLGKDPRVPALQSALLEKELEIHPDNYEAKLRLLNIKIAKADAKGKEDLFKQANEIIAAKFYERPTDMGNMNQVTMGYLIMGENSRLDSIRDVVRNRYPDSAIGIEMADDYIAKEADTLKQISLFEKSLKKETIANSKAYTGMHSRLFKLYAIKKDSIKALYHARFILADVDSPYMPVRLKEIAQVLLNNDLALDSAKAYAASALKMADNFPVGLIRYFPETGYIFPYASDSTKLAVYNKAKGNLLSMLGIIDLKKGRISEAGKNMELALLKSSDKETLDYVALFYSKTQQTGKLEELRILRRNDMLGKVIKQRISRPAPPLTSFLDLKGNAVSPESLKNKLLLIDFWATWCVPCMEEMPFVQKVYEKYKNNPDVMFLIVNSGSKNTIQDAQNWNGNKKYSFPVYYNTDRGIGEKFRFSIIPATYVIDKNGDIRFANVGFEGPDIEARLDLQVETLLNSK